VEVEIAKQILTSLGLYERTTLELIVCPTCARAQTDVIKLARRVKKAIAGINKPLRIAVMGCIVNGPGEAADADLAVCTAKNKAFIYRKGKKITTVPESKIIPELLKQLQKK
jgi:(E)-4-hydroxy-3-methylbut-2-enyl-diphosphate synthase